MRLLLAPLLCWLPLASASCNTVPLSDPDPLTYSDSLPLDEVTAAIHRSLDADHWNVVEEAPARLIADRLFHGKHLIVLEIEYGDGRVKLKYFSSENMSYDPTEEMIHKDYVDWVEGLARTIDRELHELTR